MLYSTLPLFNGGSVVHRSPWGKAGGPRVPAGFPDRTGPGRPRQLRPTGNTTGPSRCAALTPGVARRAPEMTGRSAEEGGLISRAGRAGAPPFLFSFARRSRTRPATPPHGEEDKTSP